MNKLGQEFFRQHKQSKPTDLSCSKVEASQFRGRLKDHLLCVNATGVGRLYAAAGHFSLEPARRLRGSGSGV